ncbi:MAG TPA: V-type ATPase subunit [Clostridiales bacterium]|nr:V-type ATPase subunit [Clostridiales bacterium]
MQLSSAAAYSIIPIIRAKYGIRLSLRDYDELIKLKTVAEVVAYLKNRTHYSKVLKGISETSLHRGNLEKLINKNQLNEILRICRFEKTVGEHLFSYVVSQAEIEELLKFARFLAAGHPEDYILDASHAINSFSHIDFMKLASIHTFPEFFDFIRHTKFKTVLKDQVDDIQSLDFPRFEAALFRKLYSDTFKIINTEFPAAARTLLKSLFALKVELNDILLIYRAKRFYNLDPASINKLVTGIRYLLSEKMLKRMVNAESPDEILKILNSSKYKKFIRLYGFENPELFKNHVLQHQAERLIKISINPPVVMACFIILTEIEKENLTSLIEGVRYRLSQEEIKKMLVLTRKAGD